MNIDKLRSKMIDIETERMWLSPWQVEDAEGLYQYASHEDVGPNAGWAPHSSVEESREIIEEIFQPNIVWKMVDKEDGRIIGSIGFEPDKRRDDVASLEMGYSLAKDCWGKGLMTEAAKKVLDFAFREFELEVMAIQTGPENKRSQGVIKKLGFTYEGTLRCAYKIFDGSIRDCVVYSMLRNQWVDREGVINDYCFEE